MQRLDEIVNLYLTMDTEYALMVTGDWGVGKTYYFKNTLRKQISSTPVFGNHTKKYKPILVSLFGLKSIEEIQTEIFLSLFPFLKSKIKLGASIGKAVAKGILHFKGLGEYSNYVEEIDVDKKSLIKFQELLLCFDDLERISKNLSIEEFIGYVNSLVENENVKVLIIANEGKILDKKTYDILKEKIIGNSIEFIPSVSAVFDNILLTKFSSFKHYKNFLEANKEFILTIFQKKTTNFRSLIFILNYFQQVFSEVDNKLSKEKALKEKQNEILLRLLKFSICIAMEYREGNISYTNCQNLDQYGIDINDFFDYQINQTRGQQKTKTEEEKSYKEKFKEKFYSDDTLYFCLSVYNFITGGSSFKYDDLLIELKKQFHIVENKVLPQYEIFNRLGYTPVFSLSDSEYKNLTRQMLFYTDKGAYELGTYVSVFYFATRFGNPFKFNLDNLEQRIIKGIRKGELNYKYVPELSFYLSIGKEAEHPEHLSRIRQVALEANDKILETQRISETKELEGICYSDFEEFSNKILDRRTGDGRFYYLPILDKFNAKEFFSFFVKNDNKIRWEIVQFFTSRYYQHVSSSLKPEILFLKSLKEKLEKKNSKISKSGVTYYIFNALDVSLKKAIDTLNTVK
jgi:hypothetical protein